MRIMTILMMTVMELMMFTWGTGNTLANCREGGNTTPDQDEGNDMNIRMMVMISKVIMMKVWSKQQSMSNPILGPHIQFSHLLVIILKRRYTGKALLRSNCAFRHRAALCQLLGSPERNDNSPHLAASTKHPVGCRHLAKLLIVMTRNPRWGEEGWRNNWRRR